MNTEEIIIRTVSPDDAAELLSIYAPYVEKTAISFEYEVPRVEEFQKRIEKTLENYPYLAAECGGRILGYVYAGPFIGRAAYGWSAEVSIYLREDCRKKGLGRRLYEALEAVSGAQNILNLNACIGCPRTEDIHLTNNSMQFHEHMGYRLVGRFQESGYKFNTWYDMVWMEKILGEHVEKPAPVIAFSRIGAEQLNSLGIRSNGKPAEEFHIV